MREHGARWRIARWTAALLILATPALAMRLTDEVQWDLADFAVAAVLLGGVCLAYDVAARAGSSASYRAGAAIGLLATLLLVWVSAAVGIIGSEAHAANLLYLGPIAVGIAGAGLCRLRPSGLALTALAMAASLVAIGGLAVLAEWGERWDVLAANGMFATLFVVAAVLFEISARTGATGGAVGDDAGWPSAS